MIVVGLMSATSMDGLDVAVGSFELDGDVPSLTPLGAAGRPWQPELRSRLLQVLPPGATGSAIPRVLGRLSPGNAPLRLPEPARAPRRLVVLPSQQRSITTP